MLLDRLKASTEIKSLLLMWKMMARLLAKEPKNSFLQKWCSAAGGLYLFLKKENSNWQWLSVNNILGF